MLSMGTFPLVNFLLLNLWESVRGEWESDDDEAHHEAIHCRMALSKTVKQQTIVLSDGRVSAAPFLSDPQAHLFSHPIELPPCVTVWGVVCKDSYLPRPTQQERDDFFEGEECSASPPSSRERRVLKPQTRVLRKSCTFFLLRFPHFF